MGLKLTNNATSTLAASITNAATSLTVESGDAGLFPSLGANDWFPLTVIDGNGNLEIMLATARAGAVITVVRAQEGTTAKAFPAGARVDLRVTAVALRGTVQAQIVDAAAKATPANNDLIGLLDSAANFVLKKLTWANLLAALDLDNRFYSRTNGENLATTVGNKLDKTATAANADKVDNLHAASFVRADASDNVTGHTEWQDSYEARFGNSADVRIRHDGSNSQIDNHTGHLYLRNLSNSNTHGIYIQDEDSAGALHNCAIFEHDRVLLYYDNSVKLQTDGSGVTVTGRLHATDRMYVGANGGGDSWIEFYDDNSNTWRFLGWDDSSNAFVMEENDGGLHKIAGVSTDSNANTTNFPIGHTLIAGGTASTRCISRALYLYSGSSNSYVDSTHSQRSSQLTGTWRAHGGSTANHMIWTRVA